MSAFTTALAPPLVLILVGYGLKRAHFIPDQAWSGIERLTYFVLFPALLVHTLGAQTLEGAPWAAMLAVVAATLAVAAAVLVIWHRMRASVSGPAFTSIFQGGVRFNTYIALAVIQAFFGSEGLALGAVAAGFMIVLINLLCVAAFAVWGRAAQRGAKLIVREVLVNPLILSCSIGWILSLSGIGLPGLTDNILEIIGRAALPLGLLAVGAALKPEAMRGHIGPVSVSSVVQFGLKPLIVVLLVAGTGLGGVAASVLIIAFMTPTASSGYILARQLGGDTEAMASIITFQTLFAFLAMPLIALVALQPQ